MYPQRPSSSGFIPSMGSTNMMPSWTYHGAFDGGMGASSSTAKGLESAPSGRCMGLRQKHQSLIREQLAERQEAEELQGRLVGEMRELRDQCNEQGQMVGKLMQRLSDARGAVTSDLQNAQAVRAILGGELKSEELQRQALEDSWRSEEAEFQDMIQKAKGQLATMTKGNASLEAQLKRSHVGQAQLRSYIAAERSGRAELKKAGEQECVAYNENNSKVYGELQHSLHDFQTEQAEIDSWRHMTNQEMSQLHLEISEYKSEEDALHAEVQSARDRKNAQNDVEGIQAQLRQIELQHNRATTAAQRFATWRGAAECERQHWEEDLQQCLAIAQSNQCELIQINQRKALLQQELDAMLPMLPPDRGAGVNFENVMPPTITDQL